MALILTMRKGECFYVEDSRVEVTSVEGDDHFVLRDDKGREYDITDDKMTEIMPNVLVSVGSRGTEGTARVAIEAPRTIMILREQNYLRGLNAIS